MQTGLTQGKYHRYSEVRILPDSIPVWGVCESRRGSSVILRQTAPGTACLRCILVFRRTPVVIQVYSRDPDQCYPDEASARASCPTLRHIRDLTASETMLYKTRSLRDDGRIERQICPFVGRFRFSYGAFDGERRGDLCLDLTSYLATCPSASQIKLKFKDCTFGSLDVRLECLGSWTGFDGLQYMALFDPDTQNDLQPRYRCGMYHRSASGRVAFSLSSDASCSRHLESPWRGFESFSLSPFNLPTPPRSLLDSPCAFPEWSQGKWQDVQISGGQMEFRDELTDQFHKSLCLFRADESGETFFAYSVNQCGEESFTCIRMKQRSENVMEFILSTGDVTKNKTTACSDDKMWKASWRTQARKAVKPARCPVSGRFIGRLPDDTSLCAALNSDCSRKDYMMHTVFPCDNETVKFEERYYQCLGQWDEAGVTYIYTWRRDVHKYECFAGVMASEDQLFLMEAGATCKRGVQPLVHGMKIRRTDSCEEKIERAGPVGLALLEEEEFSNVIETGRSGRHLWSYFDFEGFPERLASRCAPVSSSAAVISVLQLLIIPLVA